MFERILIAISSEFYTKEVLLQGAIRAQRFVKRSVWQLLADGQRYVDEMQKNGVSAQMTSGSFVDETFQNAKRLHAGLVVVSQEQKRYDIMGLPVRSMNQRLAEKSRSSMVFVR